MVDAARLISDLRHALIAQGEGEHAASMKVSLKRLGYRSILSKEARFLALATVRSSGDGSRRLKRSLFLKQPLHPEVEYATLREISSLARERGKPLGVPRPIALLDQGVVAMEYIPRGHSFLNTLHLGLPLYPLRKGGIEKGAQDIADWLTTYQRVVYNRKTSDLRGDLRRSLEVVEGLECLSRKERAIVVNGMGRDVGGIRDVPILPAHGEFLAKNVIRSPKGVTVVDWDWSGRERNYLFDVQTFLINLERCAAYPHIGLTKIRRVQALFWRRYLHYSMFTPSDPLVRLSRCMVLAGTLRQQLNILKAERVKSVFKRVRAFVAHLKSQLLEGSANA